MQDITGCFQFFYSSRDTSLPHPDVPTRDVTNTAHAGEKTEPFLERRVENWCACRARFVAPRVREALRVTAGGGRHSMVLTTRHPTTGRELAVGLLDFSPVAYDALTKRFPNRWSDDFLPYTGGTSSKLVTFARAFDLRPWMDAQKPAVKYVPGKRYGMVKADTPARQALLGRIIAHLSAAPDCRAEFLANVRHLERRLRRNGPQAAWLHYQERVLTGRVARCSPRR